MPLGWPLSGTLDVATRPRRPQAEALAEYLIVRDMPLRMLTLGSGGKVSVGALRRLLALLNGARDKIED